MMPCRHGTSRHPKVMDCFMAPQGVKNGLPERRILSFHRILSGPFAKSMRIIEEWIGSNVPSVQTLKRFAWFDQFIGLHG